MGKPSRGHALVPLQCGVVAWHRLLLVPPRGFLCRWSSRSDVPSLFGDDPVRWEQRHCGGGWGSSFHNQPHVMDMRWFHTALDPLGQFKGEQDGNSAFFSPDKNEKCVFPLDPAALAAAQALRTISDGAAGRCNRDAH